MLRELLILLTSFIVSFVALPIPTQAQETIGSFDVFLNTPTDQQPPTLFFLNVRTGLSKTVIANGTGHTLINNRVLYQENESKTVKVAYPDERIEPFTAIELSDPNAKVNWVVSSNRQWIAWSVSVTRDQTLLADLFIAKTDGSNRKLVLHTSSTKGIDTLPLAVVDNGTTIFYVRQPSDVRPYQLFPVAVDAFQLNVASGQSTELAGKTDCLCAIGFSADGQFIARLDGIGGNLSFSARVWDMSINKDTAIPAAKLAHRQAGYLLISRDGSLIVYTSARGVAPAAGVPPERYAIVLIDVLRHEQRTLASLLTEKLRPIAFEEDNSAVMLVGDGGTYKLTLEGGELRNVSPHYYLGAIEG